MSSRRDSYLADICATSTPSLQKTHTVAMLAYAEGAKKQVRNREKAQVPRLETFV